MTAGSHFPNGAFRRTSSQHYTLHHVRSHKEKPSCKEQDHNMTLSQGQANIPGILNAVPAKVQAALGKSPWDVPTFDQWLSQNLSAPHQQLYAQLMESRFTSTEPFPVDFDDLWKAIGFAMKHKAVEALTRNHVEGVDYSLVTQPGKQSGDENTPGRGGHNAKRYVLTIDCAQRFALAAGTERGKEVRTFFVKTMAAVQDYHLLSLLVDKQLTLMKSRHDLLIRQYPKGAQVYYRLDVGFIDGQRLQKAGSSDQLKTRVSQLISQYGTGYLTDVIESPKNRRLESLLKDHPVVKAQRVEKYIKGNRQTELFEINARFTDDIFGEIVREMAKQCINNEPSQEEVMMRLRIEELQEKRALVEALTKAGLPGADFKETLKNLLPDASLVVESDTVASNIRETDEIESQQAVPLSAESDTVDPIGETLETRRSSTDLQNEFIEAHLVVTGNDQDRIHQNHLYRIFTAWISERKVNVTQKMKTVLKKKLAAIEGVTYLNSTRVTSMPQPSPGFHGVAFTARFQ